jgi:CBS domain-containing protein
MTTKPQTTLRAADIMTAEPVCIEPGMTIREAARLFDEHEISGAPVVDAAGRLVGVVSRTDLVRRYMSGDDDRDPRMLAELFSYDDEDDDGPLPDQVISVEDFMSTDPVSAPPTASLRELAERMLRSRVHRVIIVDGQDTPVGIVTSLDLVRGLAGV